MRTAEVTGTDWGVVEPTARRWWFDQLPFDPVASTSTLVPALQTHNPSVTVDPSTHLTDGQAVQVQIAGFGQGGKYYVSARATAEDANSAGCGPGLPRQPSGARVPPGSPDATEASRPYSAFGVRTLGPFPGSRQTAQMPPLSMLTSWIAPCPARSPSKRFRPSAAGFTGH